ncbi:type VII secretion integral membrane protein EccD [Mycolicibacterium sp. S2-37]|uniref:type VII secretion integral membrane protein EccD n=1 Tax=Mycolicibacterium sp. S2-37 TaxID=2810297 RepID=UPI001A94A348|nr:type VII secretion integral membrane protein EccD [Mycolicibacterium sp. S2-37]MBO0678853.1 type VII secretion integral membrane protein EccD [Mycolicibacterium sp. S2-37]
MSDAVCLVSVHTGAGAAMGVDLALPEGVPLAVLLPEIVDLTAGRDGGPVDWRLSRVGGSVLDPRRTLRELDVRDGDLLMLEAAEATAPDFDRDDWPARIVAAAPEASMTTPAATVAGSVLAVLGVLLCGAVAGTGPVAMATAAMLLCGVALGAATASRSGSAATAPLGVLTVLLAAATGARAVPGDLSAAHALLAATAAMVASFALLRFRIGDTVVLTALACTAALIASCGLAAVSVPLPAASAAALLSLTSLGVLSGSPRLSLLLAGLGPAAIDPDPTTDADERAASGHRILAGLVLGASAAVTLAALAVAASTLHRHGPWMPGALLCGAAGLVLLLRARTFSSGRCRWNLLTNGICCLAIAVVITVSALPEHAHWVGAALVCAGVIATMRAGRDDVSPVAARALDIAEYVAIASVPPLVCAVVDLYGLVRNLVLW